MTSTHKANSISDKLLEDIKLALLNVGNYGSVELFIQEGTVTQITTRNIKKTNKFNAKSKRR